MLNFDSLTPQQKQILASKNADIAALLREEEEEKQQLLDSVITPEKYQQLLEKHRKQIEEFLVNANENPHVSGTKSV